MCGNGTREGPEQCDDGNTQNLDGCDAACAFEQDHRSNSLLLQFSTDAYCTANKFGAAITPIAQSIVQNGLTNGVAQGTSGLLFKVFGLEDLTGTVDDPMLELGVVTATPIAGAGYNGASDLDWWYTVSPASIDANRNPNDKVPGSIMSGVLNAGPGSMSMSVNLFQAQALLRLSSVKLQIGIGPSNAPTQSAAGMPPGHIPAENLSPALTSFAFLGTAANGKVCSNISAKSLSQTPIPPALLPGGQFPCTENYAGANSLLDVIVGGCSISFVGPVVLPSQPDQVDPGFPAVGAGGPYTLQTNAQKIVATCLDKNNAIADLDKCLSAAAYSSYFQFTTDRVILK
jgi:cysteine-rich repeat protein